MATCSSFNRSPQAPNTGRKPSPISSSKKRDCTTIYERSDADVRELEGLEPKVGLLRGENYQSPITIIEHDLKFLVNLQSGHKTGFYLDQRKNRLRVRELAKDRDVLDCFCYTGGFTVNALAGGAKSVLSVDSSADALELVQREHCDQRSPRGSSYHTRRRRLPTPPQIPRRSPLLRHDHPRPAEVRAHRRPCRESRRAPTRTSTCWRSNFCGTAGFWSHSRVRAELMQGCSKRSWQGQPSTRESKRRSSSICHRDSIIPSLCISPKAPISKGWCVLNGRGTACCAPTRFG